MERTVRGLEAVVAAAVDGDGHLAARQLRGTQLALLALGKRPEIADGCGHGDADLDVKPLRPELVVPAERRAGGRAAAIGDGVSDVRQVGVEESREVAFGEGLLKTHGNRGTGREHANLGVDHGSWPPVAVARLGGDHHRRTERH